MSQSLDPRDAGDARDADTGPAAVTTADGRRVAYAEYGAPDGAPVLFCHGTPGSRVLGSLFDGPARERGLRVLAPDRAGYGRSDPAPGDDLSTTADDLAAVLDHAGVDGAPVVGFSGGAAAAYALAGAHPGRVDAVHAVSGVAPPSLRDEQPAVQRLLDALAGHAPSLLSGLVRAQAWVADRASPSVVVSQYTDDEGAASLSDAQAETFRRDFVAGVGPRRSGFVRETRLVGEPWPVTPDDVGVPVHVWHGERDANVPVADARAVAEAAPVADRTVVDADHATALVQCRAQVLDACTR